MTVEIKDNNGTAIAVLSGDIDLSNSSEVRDALVKAIAEGKNVIADMSKVGYIDSSCIAGFVMAFQEAKKKNSRFALASVTQKSMRVLQLARLDKVFTIHNSVDDGIE
ncbi:MAG: STAS domain-containing protein [Alphaproteobacteria bacterium]|nr:STAS domain-containing protein [Alphaproteobacteria bacterium]